MAVPDVAISPWPTAARCALSHAAIAVARSIQLLLNTDPAAPIGQACGALNPHNHLSSRPAASFNPA
jgi:hypothetical protein